MACRRRKANPLLGVVTWALVDRFASALGVAEGLNAELGERVAAKHAELERQYARTRELEREQAVAQERTRLVGDMHDGVGASLISTLALVEHGEASTEQVTAALRDCIDDLRLAIDSLEPADGDLAPVLGGLRYRLEPRLKAAGLAVDWQVGDVPPLACLTPQNVLHVLRILQEAFTNVLRHARAHRISVSTRTAGERVSIEVSDDGTGFDPAAARARGHGLASMRRRAGAIGADLQLHSSAHGTTMSLLLPVR